MHRLFPVKLDFIFHSAIYTQQDVQESTFHGVENDATLRFLEESRYFLQSDLRHVMFEKQVIQWMHSPARSLNFYSIEHSCDHIGRKLAALLPLQSALNDQRHRLLHMWSLLPTKVFDSLLNSMECRFQSCISTQKEAFSVSYCSLLILA